MQPCTSLAAGLTGWEALSAFTEGERSAANADGIAATHLQAPRAEAARKLITDHAHILSSVLSEVRSASHSQTSATSQPRQLEQHREAFADSTFTDQFLREVARRLLGRWPGSHQLEERLDPSVPQQAVVWSQAGKSFDGNIKQHCSCAGLSAAAVSALCAVATEVGGSAGAWVALRNLLDSGLRATAANGAAAAHAHAAREEAARKLISNHSNVVRDCANPSSDLNIIGIKLTQLELERVPSRFAVFVDQFLREVVRRLLGRRPGSHELEERLDSSVPQQAQAWVQAAKYLDGRLQSTPEQKPGRTPDLGVAAAVAMRAVMAEVGGSAGAWAAMRRVLNAGTRAEADGAASAHSHAAREEAAQKLISNHSNVVRDCANPSPDLNIIGIKLTQLELERVAYEDSIFVDQFLREVARRLLGRRPGSHELEVRLDPNEPQQAVVWMQAAKYLDGRLQSTPEQKPGRTPDLGVAAAVAMRVVMAEVSGSAAAWIVLRHMLERGGRAEGVGAASAHSHAAREEAAQKLISNHSNVMRDCANPSANRNIDGKQLTQLFTLQRVAYEDSVYVDQFLREVARRLLGGHLRFHQMEVTLDPSAPQQAVVWQKAAKYIAIRIQSTPEQMLGRPPDMSVAAAAAMCAVMDDMRTVCATFIEQLPPATMAALAAANRPALKTVRPAPKVAATPPPSAATSPLLPAVSLEQQVKEQERQQQHPVPSQLAPTLDEVANSAIAQLTASGHGFQKWLASKVCRILHPFVSSPYINSPSPHPLASTSSIWPFHAYTPCAPSGPQSALTPSGLATQRSLPWLCLSRGASNTYLRPVRRTPSTLVAAITSLRTSCQPILRAGCSAWQLSQSHSRSASPYQMLSSRASLLFTSIANLSTSQATQSKTRRGATADSCRDPAPMRCMGSTC